MDPMDMVVLRINKSIPRKVIPMLLSMRMRGFIILDLKERTMTFPDLVSVGEVRNMRVGV